jgi:hypothetical protein
VQGEGEAEVPPFLAYQANIGHISYKLRRRGHLYRGTAEPIGLSQQMTFRAVPHQMLLHLVGLNLSVLPNDS